MYQVSKTCQIKTLPAIYEQLFGPSKTDGHFVEVGAYDGESFSNTSGLADMGWNGLYIEPIKDLASKCASRHARNKVLVANLAVGPEEKIVEIYYGHTLTTLKQEQVEMYEQIDWAKGHHQGQKFQVKQIPLDKVLKKSSVPVGFDLLVVDVEGYEFEVFKSFDLTHWKPRVMIVEIEDNHPSFQKFPGFVQECRALRDHIKNHGYEEYYVDEINTVFVCEELANSLKK